MREKDYGLLKDYIVDKVIDSIINNLMEHVFNLIKDVFSFVLFLFEDLRIQPGLVFIIIVLLFYFTFLVALVIHISKN